MTDQEFLETLAKHYDQLPGPEAKETAARIRRIASNLIAA